MRETVVISFPKSDGDASAWDEYRDPVLAEEKRVTLLPPESPEVQLWRARVANGLAKALCYSNGHDYDVRFPDGYQLVAIRRKRVTDRDRYDMMLFGSTHVTRFRSPNEFIPHAIWLLTDPTLNHEDCHCHGHCRGMQGGDRNASKKRPSETKVPQTSKRGRVQSLEITSRHQSSTSNNIIQPPLSPFRKGELIYIKLPQPIHGPTSSETIEFWPAVVKDVSRDGSSFAYTVTLLGSLDLSSLPHSSILPYSAYSAPPELVKSLGERATQQYSQCSNVDVVPRPFTDLPSKYTVDYATIPYLLALGITEMLALEWSLSAVGRSLAEISVSITSPLALFYRPVGPSPHQFSPDILVDRLWWGAEYICAGDLIFLRPSREFFCAADILNVSESGALRPSPNVSESLSQDSWLRETLLHIRHIFVQELESEDGSERRDAQLCGTLYKIVPESEKDAKKKKQSIATTLPAAPRGYHFRPILVNNFEAVVALELLLCRYHGNAPDNRFSPTFLVHEGRDIRISMAIQEGWNKLKRNVEEATSPGL
ncbi:hypothetical protein D9758_018215 [Tetrapyrgos nigripes]|uniref:Cryptic loci regulator 2 N-terminal domain-containing protein n=1 Tax=Tetrapyrgos nigripes TaxID=182062 RepID=A0A8H5F1W8_9AGAR|nr:hypothetical protein D9758_018215 [Tetrapyrgos nigripes]